MLANLTPTRVEGRGVLRRVPVSPELTKFIFETEGGQLEILLIDPPGHQANLIVTMEEMIYIIAKSCREEVITAIEGAAESCNNPDDFFDYVHADLATFADVIVRG